LTPPEVTVLFVEDDETQVASIGRMLEESDSPVFHVAHSDHLDSALERVLEGGIDIILLDLGLSPESEGIDTFFRVYAGAPDIPIIVLSGETDEGLAIETVHRGAQDYLVKGHVDRHWLVRSICYGIERKRAQRDLRRANDVLEERVMARTNDLKEANVRLKKEIEERSRAENALRASNAQLESALDQLRETQEHVIQRERLHALGRMASGIAHDFNNALSPILGFSELLLKRDDLLAAPESVKHYVSMIREAAQESARIVSRLREFYRYRNETEVFGPIMIDDLARDVVLLTQPRWKNQALAQGTTIRIEMETGSVPSVSGNETEIREILTNLVFNAVDAIRGSGTIWVRTAVENSEVVVEIEDDGIGMSPETRKRCLEPFFSTKSERGSGLGLGIVYGIVRRHSGTISIESEEGSGTTVRITLPIRREAAVPEEEEPLESPDHPLRILVVEDEPLVKEVITVYLDEDGHTVETAENGVEGLMKFEAGDYDVVLTDRSMPEMNGDQLALAIKRRNPKIPVVLLTGFGDLMESGGEHPSGVDIIVSKPFTFDTLRSAIAKGMQHAR
jgi:signal transduction histidine kinase